MAEGEGVEPPRLIARLRSKQLPSPIGLPFQVAEEEGFEPPVVLPTPAFKAGAISQTRPLLQMAEGAGFEPTVRFHAHSLSKRAP